MGLVFHGVQAVGREMFLLYETSTRLAQLPSVHSLVESFMCGRSCGRTLSRSSCEEKPFLCGWARVCCCCGVGGCRSASGSTGWCRWAGRCAARAPPPTDTQDTAEGKERGKKSIKHQVYFPIVSLCAVAQDKREFTHFWLMRHKAVNPRGVNASYREKMQPQSDRTESPGNQLSHQISWVTEQLPPLKSSDQHLC